ncbi:MAG: hypothetical protein U0892_20650 [Pirellulales bacterium]
MEATLIRYPEEQAAEFQKIWQVVDESCLALENAFARCTITGFDAES